MSNHITVTTTTTPATCKNIQQLVDTGLKLKADDVKILTNGGKNLADKCGKYQESIAYFDRALAVDADYVPTLYNKGGVAEQARKS